MLRRILRRPKVEDKTGLSTASIYRGIAAGTFPRPRQLTERTVGWFENEIDEWMESRQPSTIEGPTRKIAGGGDTS